MSTYAEITKAFVDTEHCIFFSWRAGDIIHSYKGDAHKRTLSTGMSRTAVTCNTHWRGGVSQRLVACLNRTVKRPAHQRLHLVSFFSSTSGEEPELSANVVQGPSVVKTALARPSPSLLMLPGLRSLPFWTRYDKESDQNRVAFQDPTVTRVVQHLEANVDVIREEYLRVAPNLPSDYQEGSPDHTASLHQGQWDWHSYMTKGVIQGQFGQYFPQTTQILQELRTQATNNGMPTQALLEDIPFGYGFFSTLHGNSKIQAHVSPMNLRLRIHLPLQVPAAAAASSSSSSSPPECGIRVGNQIQEWKEGKALVLDDSYDHEVWNNTSTTRVLFLLDLWHPDITLQERQDIVQMFQTALKNKEEGTAGTTV